MLAYLQSFVTYLLSASGAQVFLEEFFFNLLD
jgi:hypothetical protein